MKNYIKNIGQLFLICLTLNMSVGAQTLEEIKQSGVVKIGVRSNADPFSYVDTNNGASGYVVDLCKAVVENIQTSIGKKINIKYVTVTPSNRFEKINNGDINMECGVTTVTKERREKADFSYNTFVTSTNFVTLTKNKINKPRDFYEPLVQQNKKMALMKGTAHEDMVNRWVGGQKFDTVFVDSVEDGLKKVSTGEAFGFIQDKVLIEKAMNNLKMNKSIFSFSYDSLSLEPYSIMVKKGDKEMLKVVNESLNKVYVNGTAKQSLNTWLQKSDISINSLTSDAFRSPSTENAVE